MQKVRATPSEIVKIGKLLEAHCHNDEATGLAYYDDSWSDGAVAKTVDPRLNALHVASVRASMFGALLRKTTASSPTQAIDRLSARVDELEGWRAEIERRFPAAPQLMLVDPVRERS